MDYMKDQKPHYNVSKGGPISLWQQHIQHQLTIK